jgi:hypothetical protein
VHEQQPGAARCDAGGAVSACGRMTWRAAVLPLQPS